MNLFSKLLDITLSLAFPQPCHICNREVESRELGIACLRCWSETQLFDESIIKCFKCSRFLGRGHSKKAVFCNECDDDAYDTVRCVGFYEKALMKTVLYLKTTPDIPLHLQKLIRKSFQSAEFQSVDVICPIPLSKARLAERGFNQAYLIANALRPFGIKIDSDSLVRTVHTKKHRPGMDKKARQMSVENAFSVIKPFNVSGKAVLIVDDVFTSGATASNCAKALKAAGAKKVYVLAIARASTFQ